MPASSELYQRPARCIRQGWRGRNSSTMSNIHFQRPYAEAPTSGALHHGAMRVHPLRRGSRAGRDCARGGPAKDIIAEHGLRPAIVAAATDGRPHLRKRSRWACATAAVATAQQRLSFDAEQNMLFINFEGLDVRTLDDIERIRLAIESRLAPLKKRVFGIVNYENFTILPELTDDFGETVQRLVDRFYYGVARYTTSSFLAAQARGGIAASQCLPAHLRECGGDKCPPARARGGGETARRVVRRLREVIAAIERIVLDQLTAAASRTSARNRVRSASVRQRAARSGRIEQASSRRRPSIGCQCRRRALTASARCALALGAANVEEWPVGKHLVSLRCRLASLLESIM